MKYLGKITDNKDLVTKEYVDDADGALSSAKEDKSNKVTSISSSSTNTQYPSAKATFDKFLSKTENTNVSVIGTTKNTTSMGDKQLVAPNGIVFGGTAASAGLVTRGICGVSTPDAKGACSKENLYINYDGNNNFNASRQMVLNAGNIGTHLGSNMYQYTVPRGEIVKNWVNAQGFLKTHQDITGKEDVSNKITTWCATPDDTHYPSEKLVKDNLDLKSNIADLSAVATSGSYNDLTNKPTSLSQFTDNLGSSPVHTHSQYLTSHQDISGKEDQSNKTTTISSSSTDTQYPSAKAIYDYIDENSMPRINVTSSQFIDGSHIQLTDAQWNTIFGKEHRNIVYVDFDEIPGYEQYYCIIESNMDEYEYYQVRGTSYAIKLDYFTFDSSTKIVTLSHIESSTNNDDLTIGSMVKFYNDQFHKAIAGTDYEDPSNKILVWTDTSKVDDNHYPSALLTKNSLDGKVDVVSGKGLSQNDYTDAEKSLVHGANQAKGYTNYQTLITELNADDGTTYKTGQTFYIQTLNVPDVWVYSVETTSSTYTYTTDAAFVTAMQAGAVQVGKYKIAMLETLKQDLTNYALDANVVHKTGTETVAGNKTFSGTNTHTGANTIKNALKVQYGSANGCMVIGADVSGTTLTNGTRKLGRMGFPTKTNSSLICSYASLDTNDGNGVEFGGRKGDTTTTSPDYISFTTATEANSTTSKTLVAEYLQNKIQFFPGGGTNINPATNLVGKWEFYNGRTFLNNGYTYTLPNKTGTIATTADIPTVSGKEDVSNKKSTIVGNESNTTYYPNTKAVADYSKPKDYIVTLTKTGEEYNPVDYNAMVTAYNAGKNIMLYDPTDQTLLPLDHNFSNDSWHFGKAWFSGGDKLLNGVDYFILTDGSVEYYYKELYNSETITDNDEWAYLKFPTNLAVVNYAEKLDNKVSSWSTETTNTNYPSEKLVKDSLDLKEDLSNKIQTINSSSTTTQYPSAKAVYNYAFAKGNKINTINSSSTDSKVPSAKAVYTYSEALANKVSSWSDAPTNTHYPTEKLVYDEFVDMGGTVEGIAQALDDVATSVETLDNNRVSSFQQTPDNNHYPSEKLVADSIDILVTAINGLENPSNKVSSWSTTPNYEHYPSEKLVKDSLDAKKSTDFVITFTQDPDDETVCTADKTFAQVTAAINEGRTVVGKLTLSEQDYLLNLFLVDSESVAFNWVYVADNFVIAYLVILYDDESGEMYYTETVLPILETATFTVNGQTVTCDKTFSEIRSYNEFPGYKVTLNGAEMTKLVDNQYVLRYGITIPDGFVAITMTYQGEITLSEVEFEKIENKVTSISSSSTNDKYPSAKAVYDAIQAALIVDTEAAIQ